MRRGENAGAVGAWEPKKGLKICEVVELVLLNLSKKKKKKKLELEKSKQRDYSKGDSFKNKEARLSMVTAGLLERRPWGGWWIFSKEKRPGKKKKKERRISCSKKKTLEKLM